MGSGKMGNGEMRKGEMGNGEVDRHPLLLLRCSDHRSSVRNATHTAPEKVSNESKHYEKTVITLRKNWKS